MYDPLELARQTARMVCRRDARSTTLASRTWASPPPTAWVQPALRLLLGPGSSCTRYKVRAVYEPPEVAERLAAIARKKGFSQVPQWRQTP
jgi:hypothetical protein